MKIFCWNSERHLGLNFDEGFGVWRLGKWVRKRKKIIERENWDYALILGLISHRWGRNFSRKPRMKSRYRSQQIKIEQKTIENFKFAKRNWIKWCNFNNERNEKSLGLIVFGKQEINWEKKRKWPRKGDSSRSKRNCSNTTMRNWN